MQTIAGQDRTFVKEQGVFVEELFKGEQFVLMRNPFPESVSGWKTGLAKAVVSMGASAAANAATEKGIERNTGVKADVNFRTLSDEELQTLIDANQNSDDPLKQTLANGASAELAGRELERSISIIAR